MHCARAPSEKGHLSVSWVEGRSLDLVSDMESVRLAINKGSGIDCGKVPVRPVPRNEMTTTETHRPALKCAEVSMPQGVPSLLACHSHTLALL